MKHLAYAPKSQSNEYNITCNFGSSKNNHYVAPFVLSGYFKEFYSFLYYYQSVDSDEVKDHQDALRLGFLLKLSMTHLAVGTCSTWHHFDTGGSTRQPIWFGKRTSENAVFMDNNFGLPQTSENICLHEIQNVNVLTRHKNDCTNRIFLLHSHNHKTLVNRIYWETVGNFVFRHKHSSYHCDTLNWNASLH